MDLSTNMAMLSSLVSNDKSVNCTDSHICIKELGESSSSSGLSFQSMLTNLINNNLINEGNSSQLNKMMKQEALINKSIVSDMLMSGSGMMEKLSDISKPKEDNKGMDLLDLIFSINGQNVTEIMSALQNDMNVNMDSNHEKVQNVIQGEQQVFQSLKNFYTTDLGFKQATIVNQASQISENERQQLLQNGRQQLLENAMTLKNPELGEEQRSLLGKMKLANFDNQGNNYSLEEKSVINTLETEMTSKKSVNEMTMGNSNKEAITVNQVETITVNPMKENVLGWSQFQEESKVVKSTSFREKENEKQRNSDIAELSNQMPDVRSNAVQILSNSTKEIEQIEPFSQISKEIMAKIDQKGTMEFRMQLQPENLGKIDVALRMTDGKLVIDIIAASSQTQTLLVSQVDKLISSLGLQHVQVETVQVNQSQLIQPVPNYLSEASTQQQNYEHDKGQQNPQKNVNDSKSQGNITRTEIESARDANTLLEKMKYETGRMNYVI